MILAEVLNYVSGLKNEDELKQISNDCWDRIKMLRNRECANVVVTLIPNRTKVKMKDEDCRGKTFHLRGKVAIVTKVNQKTVKIEYNEKDVKDDFLGKWVVPASMLEVVTS